jgi:hypothetical protein
VRTRASCSRDSGGGSRLHAAGLSGGLSSKLRLKLVVGFSRCSIRETAAKKCRFGSCRRMFRGHGLRSYASASPGSQCRRSPPSRLRPLPAVSNDARRRGKVRCQAAGCRTFLRRPSRRRSGSRRRGTPPAHLCHPQPSSTSSRPGVTQSCDCPGLPLRAFSSHSGLSPLC